MIFTIGHASSYRQALDEGPVKKVGRDADKPKEYPNYPGGYAFETREDAQRRIDEEYPDKGYEVFGLDADWNKDTVPSDNGWWHSLINSSYIIDLAVVPKSE